MNLFNQPRPATDPAQIQQLKVWVHDILAIPSDVPVSISQLQCHEPGCSPIETVIAVMTQPPQTFKIHAAAGEIDHDAIAQALASDNAH